MSALSVSILTPSYQQARWLGDNLASVAAQAGDAIEHIVMDGGSTDGTLDILREAGDDVRWWSEPDRGQSHALNKALAHATGDIIGWLNSDDAYFGCEVIASVLEVFESRPEVGVVYGHAAYVDADGRILHYFRAPRFSARLLRNYDFLIQPAVFVRRSVLGDTLVDESFHFAMDYELWLRLAAAGVGFARIDRVLAIDRAQPGRKSITHLDVLRDDTERLARRYGVVSSGLPRLAGSLHAVWSRFAGARLALRHIDPTRLAFDARTDGPWATLVRQCLTRRRDMPIGGE